MIMFWQCHVLCSVPSSLPTLYHCTLACCVILSRTKTLSGAGPLIASLMLHSKMISIWMHSVVTLHEELSAVTGPHYQWSTSMHRSSLFFWSDIRACSRIMQHYCSIDRTTFLANNASIIVAVTISKIFFSVLWTKYFLPSHLQIFCLDGMGWDNISFYKDVCWCQGLSQPRIRGWGEKEEGRQHSMELESYSNINVTKTERGKEDYRVRFLVSTFLTE